MGGAEFFSPCEANGRAVPEPGAIQWSFCAQRTNPYHAKVKIVERMCRVPVRQSQAPKNSDYRQRSLTGESLATTSNSGSVVQTDAAGKSRPR